MTIRNESFNDLNAIDNIHKTSFPTDKEMRLIRKLRDNGNLTISLIAEINGEIAGHVAFSPVSLTTSVRGLGLGPVAVLPAFRRQGISNQLIRKGILISQRLNHDFIVVLGDPRYYQRFGFRPAQDWKLQDEYHGGEAFQAIELKPKRLPSTGGLVQYGREFAEIFG